MQDARNNGTGGICKRPSDCLTDDPLWRTFAVFAPLPFEGVDLGHTVFLAISDGVVMGVYHSEVQAAVHGDEVQEWEVR